MITGYKVLIRREGQLRPLYCRNYDKSNAYAVGVWAEPAQHEGADSCEGDACKCGYNAFKTAPQAVRYGLVMLSFCVLWGWWEQMVLAKVGLAGRVREFQLGYRAERQMLLGYVNLSRVYCHICDRLGIPQDVRQSILPDYHILAVYGVGCFAKHYVEEGEGAYLVRLGRFLDGWADGHSEEKRREA